MWASKRILHPSQIPPWRPPHPGPLFCCRAQGDSIASRGDYLPGMLNVYSLHYGKSTKVLAEVIPDNNYAGMWRIRWPDGQLSDMANLDRKSVV